MRQFDSFEDLFCNITADEAKEMKEVSEKLSKESSDKLLNEMTNLINAFNKDK